ncbi:MAG: hypothetical protein KBD07_02705 [Candidatus Omnitrophica bacterium]|jgi:hypothetical protein|nr:hypothetical protein [Candidatus Omnitrophota bacterium]
MSETTPNAQESSKKIQQSEISSTPAAVNHDRSRRMQTLPSNIRSLEDEYFFQSYLRKKRFDL